MASLQLIDTGYCNKDRSGTVESTIANSGTAVTLTQTARLALRKKANIEAEPEPGAYGTGDIDANVMSVEPGMYDLTLELSKTDATQQEIIKDLYGVFDNASYPGFMHTKGVKALIISGTSDTRKTMVELIGSTSTAFHGNEITTGLPALLVHVETIHVLDTAITDRIQVKIGLREA